MCKVLFDAAATAISYIFFSFGSITKVFFTIQGTADFCNVLNYERPTHQILNI